MFNESMTAQFGRRFVQNVAVLDRSRCLDAGGHKQRMLVVDVVVADQLHTTHRLLLRRLRVKYSAGADGRR